VALDASPSILLDKPILLLGRHPECDIQIDSRKISRRHCCIAQVNDYLIVRDLGSTNGIRINGVRVLEGRLAEGDELTIGSHRYQVSWEAVLDPRSADRRDKATPHRLPREDIEDDLLESSDDPVPLAEPPSPAREQARSPKEAPPEAHPRPPIPLPRPLKGLHPPKPSPAAPAADGRAPSPPGRAEESLILPDELQLLPRSDAYPKLPSSAPGSPPSG